VLGALAASPAQAHAQLSATGTVEAGTVKITTTDLNLRKGPGLSYGVVVVLKKATFVTTTGETAHGFAELYAKGRKGWASMQYLANSHRSLPDVIGIRTATANLLIRTSAGADFRSVGTIKKGSKVSVTGASTNGRAQIVFEKAARWVTAKYLARTPPATPSPGSVYAVEKGLKPNAIKVHRAALKAWPQITRYYGVRPEPIRDHPSGRALDLVIPSYKSTAGKALGSKVAAWARRNHQRLGIEYIIWNQHIWNVRRAKEGWRHMADRGSDSANHKNHVHVTVFG
jgi:uncharacterized protein YraI